MISSNNDRIFKELVNDLNDSFNQNPENREYREQIERKIEILKSSFKKIDKNSDDLIDQKELLEFLDHNVPAGKIYDRNTFKKIFSTLDTDGNGNISVGEFIRTYIKIEEEFKLRLQEAQTNIEATQQDLEKYRRLMNENRNEVLNQEGISKNASVVIEVINVYQPNKSPVNFPVSVSVKYLNELQSTGTKREAFSDFNKRFEFPVQSRKTTVYLQVYNSQAGSPLLVGECSVPLVEIENQDEHILELEIDEDDENVESLVLKLKVRFIWSFFSYYQELYNKTEQIYITLKQNLERGNATLESLVEPFKFISQLENAPLSESKIQPRIVIDSSIHNQNMQPAIIAKETQYKYADKVENFIKEKLNKPNIQWLPFIKLVIYTNILLSFLNLFARGDFINLIIPLTMLVVFYTTFNSSSEYYLDLFLKMLGVSIGMDILWLIFHSYAYAGSITYDAGMEKSLRGFVLFVSFIALLVRTILTIAIWIEKLKTERRNEVLLKAANRQV